LQKSNEAGYAPMSSEQPANAEKSDKIVGKVGWKT